MSGDRTIPILHLEDNADDAELVAAALEQGGMRCEALRVDTRPAFAAALERGGWEVILADYSLPGFDGVTALRLALDRRPEIPFIFVTGSLGEERAVETITSGATDFILKHRLERLPQAVRRARRESETARARQDAEQRLRASLREKELLLYEVHHRVHNNLQIICSLLGMHSEALGEGAGGLALLESLNRVRAMALVHAMLHESVSVTEVDFAEYIETLAGLVAESYRAAPAKARLTVEAEPLWLETDRAIPCGLILNEWLSHAFKGGGRPQVALGSSGGRVRMTVEDDYMAAWGDSFGSLIVEALSKQLGGSVEVAGGEGTRFALSFPLRVR